MFLTERIKVHDPDQPDAWSQNGSLHQVVCVTASRIFTETFPDE